MIFNCKYFVFWTILFIPVYIIAYGADENEKIGMVCDLNKEGAVIFHYNNKDENKISKGESLFYNDQINTKNSTLTLKFPYNDNCDINSEVDIKLKEYSDIILEKPTMLSTVYSFIPFIKSGLFHVIKKGNVKLLDNNDKLYVKTNRLNILVFGSDFLIIETEKFTLIFVNDNITKLDVKHKKCGGIYTLDTMGSYKFTDDCEMIYQKKTEKEINQILNELNVLPTDTLNNDNIEEYEVAKANDMIIEEKNELRIANPQFPSKPELQR